MFNGDICGKRAKRVNKNPTKRRAIRLAGEQFRVVKHYLWNHFDAHPVKTSRWQFPALVASPREQLVCLHPLDELVPADCAGRDWRMVFALAQKWRLAR